MTIYEYLNYTKKFKTSYNFGLGEDQDKVPFCFFKSLLKKIFFNRKIKYNDKEIDKRIYNKISSIEKHNYSSIGYKNIALTNGSTQGVFSSILSLKNKINKVLIFTPSYPLYFEICSYFNFDYKEVSLEKNKFNLTFRTFINSLDKDTNLVILNTPNNPTSASYSENELSKIINYCHNKNIFLIIDQVYFDFNYQKIDLKLPLNEHTFYIKSLSKSFNMTGLRIGYIITTWENIEKINSLLKMMNVSVSTINKTIVNDMLNNLSYKRKLYHKYLNNKKLIDKTFKENYIEYIPIQGTFYCFINIKKFKKSSMDVSLDLLKKQEILLLPSILFHHEDYLRLSYACSYKKLKNGLKRICSYFND